MKKKTEGYYGDEEDAIVDAPDKAERASITKGMPMEPVVETDSGIKSRIQAHARKVAEIQGGK